MNTALRTELSQQLLAGVANHLTRSWQIAVTYTSRRLPAANRLHQDGHRSVSRRAVATVARFAGMSFDQVASRIVLKGSHTP